ncbi:hypothetical protein CQ054_22915, partial [Ochrobactrum sp. MYb29]
MAGEFQLSAQQINKMNEITNKGSSNYAAGYDYLRQQIETFLNAPENASHPDRQAYQKVTFWLQKAAEINRNDPNSPANGYIRDVARSGLLFDGKDAGPDRIQTNSNKIGLAVIENITTTGHVPNIGSLIEHDVQSAIKGGGQTLGGWGGTFFYWNMQMSPDPNDTVGSRILNDPVEYEKFIAITAKALLDAAQRLQISPQEFLEQAQTGM